MNCPLCKREIAGRKQFHAPTDDELGEFIGTLFYCGPCALFWEELPNERLFRKVQIARTKLHNELSLLASRFQTEFQEAIATVFNRRPMLHLRLEDQIRLLNLRVPMLRHHITLIEVVEMLGRFYPPRVTGGYNLGWRISIVTGPTAIRRIDEEVARQYPNGENIQAWRSQEKQKQMRILDTASDNTPDSVQEYLEQISQTRKSENILQKRLSRRRYRNNPWP